MGRAAIVTLVCLGPTLFPTVSQSAAKYSSIVVDAKTGKTLFSRNADSHRYPASLTKIMTLYVLFEEMARGRVSESTRMKVSKRASRQAPSKLGLKPGRTIRARDAIRALVTKSANDVAVVIAEHISGSVPAFAARMTQTARRIGMSRTTFKNPHGLPNSRQKTTARDMARLGRAIQERFPKRYRYFSTRSFKYGRRRYRNHNRLLGKVRGVDGIKTGYTRASGFNLVTSVRNKGRHVVAVVMGGKTGRKRDAHMRYLIGRYVPKASRGRKSSYIIVAKRKKPPLPRRAPRRRSKPIVVAAKKAVRAPQPQPIPVKRTPTMHVASAFAVLSPLPTRKPLSRSITAAIPKTVTKNPQVFAVAALPSKTDAMATGSVEPVRRRRPGWIIQIGAMPTRTSAIALLDKAKSRTGRTLRGRDPFTETVEKNDQTLYRARFAGFKNRSSARAACKALKRRKFACLPLQQ